MLQFIKDRWAGNKWPSIEMTPEDVRYFPRVLFHLMAEYGLETPPIVDTIDGCACDFVILGSRATLMVDTWSFSLAFAEEAVRDRVWQDLASLPANYFGTAADPT